MRQLGKQASRFVNYHEVGPSPIPPDAMRPELGTRPTSWLLTGILTLLGGLGGGLGFWGRLPAVDIC